MQESVTHPVSSIPMRVVLCWVSIVLIFRSWPFKSSTSTPCNSIVSAASWRCELRIIGMLRCETSKTSDLRNIGTVERSAEGAQRAALANTKYNPLVVWSQDELVVFALSSHLVLLILLSEHDWWKEQPRLLYLLRHWSSDEMPIRHQPRKKCQLLKLNN
jgi:hypothetical protein